MIVNAILFFTLEASNYLCWSKLLQNQFQFHVFTLPDVGGTVTRGFLIFLAYTFKTMFLIFDAILRGYLVKRTK